VRAASAAGAELSSAAAGSTAVTAAVSSIRRDLLMARLLNGGRRRGTQHWPTCSRLVPASPEMVSPRHWP
jgi:hypothetical protein